MINGSFNGKYWTDFWLENNNNSKRVWKRHKRSSDGRAKKPTDLIMALKMLYRGPSSRLETLIEKIQQNKDSNTGTIDAAAIDIRWSKMTAHHFPWNQPFLSIFY